MKGEDIMSRPLITKYRPTAFTEVVGNVALVQSLANAVRKQARPHGYLFTGISGIGKTTLAYIVAKEINAHIEEIDAATYSGVETAREIVNISYFSVITGEPNRLLLIDEAHCLSNLAWNPYLKLIEKSPKHNYFAFCTTDPTNIPDTIKTRCFPVALKPLTSTDLRTYIADIAEREGWTVQHDVLTSIVLAAKGSPRMALSFLEAGHDAHSVGELAQIISPEPIAREHRPTRNMAVDPVDEAQLEQLRESISRIHYLRAKER
jgi:DNA polymerase-3 subunit gamma/tau